MDPEIRSGLCQSDSKGTGVISSGMQPASVHSSPGQESRSRLIAMIQEAFCEDLIRTPLKVDGTALPGAQEWNPASLQGRESLARFRSRHPLADHEGSRPGPIFPNATRPDVSSSRHGCRARAVTCSSCRRAS